MSNTYIGNAAGGSESPVNSNWDPVKGWSTTRKFRGTEAYVREMESDMILQGYTTQLTAGAVWELSASVAADTRDGNPPGMGPNDVVDTWELFANKVEKDILASDVTVVHSMTEPNIHWMRELANGDKKASDWDSSTTAKTPPFSADFDSMQLFRAIIGGSKSQIIYQPTIRHTQTMPSGSTITAYTTYAGKIYSTAKLVSTYNVPSNIASALKASASHTRSSGLVLYDGWLMDHPSVTIAAGQRLQLVQEWTWGEWAPVMFGASCVIS